MATTAPAAATAATCRWGIAATPSMEVAFAVAVSRLTAAQVSPVPYYECPVPRLPSESNACACAVRSLQRKGT